MSVKKLPNRDYPLEYEGREFSTKFVEDLRIKFGFEDSFQLKKKLEEIWHGYGAHAKYELDRNTKTDQIKILGKLSKSCDSLCTGLRALGSPEKTAVCRYAGSDFDFNELEETISALGNYLEFAINDIGAQKSKGGRPKKDSMNNLSLKLAIEFEQGTGKNPKPYWSDINEQFQGGSLQFVHTVLSHMDVNINKNTLGDIIRAALRNHDKVNNLNK